MDFTTDCEEDHGYTYGWGPYIETASGSFEPLIGIGPVITDATDIDISQVRSLWAAGSDFTSYHGSAPLQMSFGYDANGPSGHPPWLDNDELTIAVTSFTVDGGCVVADVTGTMEIEGMSCGVQGHLLMFPVEMTEHFGIVEGPAGDVEPDDGL